MLGSKAIENLPPMTRVLLGVATEQEKRICILLMNELSQKEWRKVFQLYDKISLSIRSSRNVESEEEGGESTRFHHVVEAYYSGSEEVLPSEAHRKPDWQLFKC